MLTNGQLEEGLLVLVYNLSYWEYDRAKIEYLIIFIPFHKNLIEVLVDAQCHYLTNSCFFTDNANDTLETANIIPAHKCHDLNSELNALGTIFLILFLVIIISKAVIVIRKRLQTKRVVPINVVPLDFLN